MSANRPQSILVDARGIRSSGIGRFLREVLVAIFQDPRFGRVTLLGNAPDVRSFVAEQGDPDRTRILDYPDEFYSLRVQAAWLRIRGRLIDDADVSFFPHYDAPLVGMPRRSVVTVLDLIHFKVPEVFAAWRRMAASVLLARAVSQAARIITISESTRRDLVERIPSADGKVDVVQLGVSSYFRAIGGAEEACRGATPAGPYLLCVGNRKPHKNLTTAVEVLSILRKARPDLRLVVVGQRYPGSDAVRARAEELHVSDALVELDVVDDHRLRCLYSECELLLFPSLYEGFGLPILEAFACGAPVVASNRSSVPEVVGDAGLLVSPLDPVGIADAVRRVMEDVTLREMLIERGLRRAAEHSWRRSGEKAADILYAVSCVGARLACPPEMAGPPGRN